VWFATQLLPSPQLVVHETEHDETKVAFGAQWQVTPVLYSFGIHRSQNPWRTVVVEPIVRQSGSIEWHITPHYFSMGGSFSNRWGLRSGIRSYVPVVQRGDYLSLSFGVSMLRVQGGTSVVYEAGSHVLFGFVGLMVGYSPTPGARRLFTTLQLRFF